MDEYVAPITSIDLPLIVFDRYRKFPNLSMFLPLEPLDKRLEPTIFLQKSFSRVIELVYRPRSMLVLLFGLK